MTLLWKILKVAGSLLLVALLGALGGLLGAYLGGNYWVNFSLFGVRGYEALGLVGFLVGLLGGAILIRMLFLKRKDK
jgi:hypothetical protein